MKLSLIMCKGHTILGLFEFTKATVMVHDSWMSIPDQNEVRPGRSGISDQFNFDPVRLLTIDLVSYQFSKTVAICFGDGKFKAPLALNGETSAFKMTVSW